MENNKGITFFEPIFSIKNTKFIFTPCTVQTTV
jgi:hypothetical protein